MGGLAGIGAGLGMLLVFGFATGLVLSFALIGAKADSAYDGSWVSAMAGVWLMDAAVMVAVIGGCVAVCFIPDIPMAYRILMIPGMLLTFIVFGCFVVWSILIGVALESSDSSPAPMKRYIPCFIGQCIFIVLSFLGLFTACVGDRDGDSSPAASFVAKLGNFFGAICTLAFHILTAQKLEGDYTSSWVVVCVPLYVAIGINFFTQTLALVFKNGAGGAAGCCGPLMGAGVLLTGIILTARHADGDSPDRLVLAFIPFFIQSGFVWIAACIGMCAVPILVASN